MNPRLATQVAWRGLRGPSLRALVGAAAVRLDAAGVRAAFGEAPPGDATCIAGARWSWLAGPGAAAEARPLAEALTAACAGLPAGRVALALSGGVDSAVLAALLRDRVVAYTLAPALPDYSEVDAARAIAGRLGLAWRPVPVTADDLVAALPAAIEACEGPLYNLHPVGRYLLAAAVRADGFEYLLTGDGADEVHRGTSGADYLPIVGALTRAAGLTAVAPFLDPGVAASVPRDPDKRALRDLACALDVPRPIARGAKRPRFAPALDLSRHRDPARVAALGRALGRTPGAATDRERVAWTTLALFARGFAGLELVCAA